MDSRKFLKGYQQRYTIRSAVHHRQTFAMPESSDNGSSSNGGNQNSPHDDNAAPRDAHPDNASVPKPKRLACMICRKRKLKCDGIRPSCSTCSRLGHNCAYDEQRRKSGPKRGYVKALEERLSENPRQHPFDSISVSFSLSTSYAI